MIKLAYRTLLVYSTIVLSTLAFSEIILQIVRPEKLSIAGDVNNENNLPYKYDATLGWAPIPNSTQRFSGTRTINVHQNELGLRDTFGLDHNIEESIVFVGDSFVWGFDVEAEERFTDLLQHDLPMQRIVNAGVAGYGTDQEYLWLQRVWDRLKPRVVVLIYCTDNDHIDNSSNKHGEYYKPYYSATLAQAAQFHGIPVPLSKSYLFTSGWLASGASHLVLVRLGASLYNRLINPEVHVPDPSLNLIALMKGFVEARGAKFLVGIQYNQGRDANFEASLQREGIAYVSLDGLDHFAGHGEHWTPEAHAIVAKRLLGWFQQQGIPGALTSRQSAAISQERGAP
jgi:GDSL-like lipase/acylhydrolase family protein